MRTYRFEECQRSTALTKIVLAMYFEPAYCWECLQYIAIVFSAQTDPGSRRDRLHLTDLGCSQGKHVASP